jgi:hypothetical protein
VPPALAASMVNLVFVESDRRSNVPVCPPTLGTPATVSVFVVFCLL